jgi:hypothetical protein
MLAPTDARDPASAPTITATAILFLAVMAVAIPAAPIEGAGVGGLLVGRSLVSEGLAETLAQAGYGYLAVDLSDASVGGEDDYWVGRLEGVRRRQFPVWGWIDAGMDKERVSRLIGTLSLSGLYVSGPEAASTAAILRAAWPRLPVVPVVRFGDAPPRDGEYAVAMEPADFLRVAAGFDRPVLLADRLDMAAIRVAREVVGGACLVARTPVVARGK